MRKPTKGTRVHQTTEYYSDRKRKAEWVPRNENVIFREGAGYTGICMLDLTCSRKMSKAGKPGNVKQTNGHQAQRELQRWSELERAPDRLVVQIRDPRTWEAEAGRPEPQ